MFELLSSTEEEREATRTSPSADDAVEEGALQFDERMAERSVPLDPPFVLSFDAAEKEGVECVRGAVEQFGCEVNSGTEPVFDADDEGEDKFLDVVGGGQRGEGAESEVFTFADALMHVNLISKTVLEGVVNSYELPLC